MYKLYSNYKVGSSLS